MESLQIKTGKISLQILDDDGNERGIFSFNPEDIESAKKFVDMQGELKIKQKEFNDRTTQCKTAEERADLLSDIVQYLRNLIDEDFGENSSNILFGTACTLSMFENFFTGITPYYKKASNDRIAKYKNKKSKVAE